MGGRGDEKDSASPGGGGAKSGNVVLIASCTCDTPRARSTGAESIHHKAQYAVCVASYKCISNGHACHGRENRSCWSLQQHAAQRKVLGVLPDQGRALVLLQPLLEVQHRTLMLHIVQLCHHAWWACHVCVRYACACVCVCVCVPMCMCLRAPIRVLYACLCMCARNLLLSFFRSVASGSIGSTTLSLRILCVCVCARWGHDLPIQMRANGRRE